MLTLSHLPSPSISIPYLFCVCVSILELALVLNTFGKFCIEGDEDENLQEEAQVRSLVKRLIEQRMQEEEEDVSSDFDD